MLAIPSCFITQSPAVDGNPFPRNGTLQSECSPIPLTATMHPQASPVKLPPRLGELPLCFKALPDLPKPMWRLRQKYQLGRVMGKRECLWAGRPGWGPRRATASEVPGLNTLNRAPWQRRFASSLCLAVASPLKALLQLAAAAGSPAFS